MNISSLNTAVNRAVNNAVTAPPANTPKRSEETPKPEVVAAVQKKANVDAENLQQAVARANEFLKPINSGVQFEITDDKKVVIKLVDKTTGETLKQYPSESMLKIAEALQGLLDEQA